MKKQGFLIFALLLVTGIQFFPNDLLLAKAKGGPITEKEVKDYMAYTYCKASDGCVISFDSPIKIGAATRHAFQIPATNYLCYPVKLNYSTHTQSGLFRTHHYTNAVYYFFRNGFGEWEMNKENEKVVEVR